MHSIRIIGPGRAGTSLAAALSARGLGVRRLPRAPRRAGARRRRCRPARHRHPRRRRRRGRGRGRAVAGHHRGPPLGFARARRPGAAPAAGGRAPAGAAAQRRGRRRPSRLGRHLRRGRGAAGPRRGRPASAAAWSRWPTATGRRTTPPPASRPTTWWPCWARWSGWPPRSGLDLESFLPLTRAAVDDVAALGAGPALTGPARRGDWATLSRHLDALPESERAGYQAGAALATRLAQQDAAAVRSRRTAPAEPAAV